MREKGSQNQDEEPERMSRLAVIGAGYMGARDECHPRRLGHDICYADIVSEKMAMLSRGEIPMVELGCSLRSSGMPAAGRRAGGWRAAEGAAWTSR